MQKLIPNNKEWSFCKKKKKKKKCWFRESCCIDTCKGTYYTGVFSENAKTSFGLERSEFELIIPFKKHFPTKIHPFTHPRKIGSYSLSGSILSPVF